MSSTNQWQKSSCQQQLLCPEQIQEKLCLFLLLHQPCPVLYPLNKFLTPPTPSHCGKCLFSLPFTFPLHYEGLHYCPPKFPCIITEHLNIFQYNVRKSNKKVMAFLLADPRVSQSSLFAIQEPFYNSYSNSTQNSSLLPFISSTLVLKITEFVFLFINLSIQVLGQENF